MQDFDEEWAKKIQIEKFKFHNSIWLDMIENTRNGDTRNGMYGSMAKAGRPGGNYDQDYYNPDDEPLENYLAVEDADMVADKGFGMPNDYYYTG